MAQRHATYENSNRSHQIPCEKSFQTVYGLPIFADPRVWLLKGSFIIPTTSSIILHISNLCSCLVPVSQEIILFFANYNVNYNRKYINQSVLKAQKATIGLHSVQNSVVYCI